MKIEINVNAFLPTLQNAGILANTKNSIMAFQNVMFMYENGKLSITSADGQNFARYIVSCLSCEAEEGEAFCVGSKLIIAALSNLRGEMVTISHDKQNQQVTIAHKKGHATIPSTDETELFKIKNEEWQNTMNINSTVLLYGIDTTRPFVAFDQLRLQLNGIFFDTSVEESSLTLCATDAKMLTKCVIKEGIQYDGNADSFILSTSSVDILKSSLGKDVPVRVVTNKTNVGFYTEDMTFIARLVEGRYPNYNSVIPTEYKIACTIDRSETITAVSRLLPFGSQISPCVRICLEESKVRIISEDLDFKTNAEESVSYAMPYEGSPFVFALDSKKLLSVLQSFNTEKIELHLIEPSRAVVFVSSEEPERTTLLMPLVLND